MLRDFDSDHTLTADLRLPNAHLPTVWFRNTWSWTQETRKPSLSAAGPGLIELDEPQYGHRWLVCNESPALLFTENESNNERMFGFANASPYVKDGINDSIVAGAHDRCNPAETGTKAAAHYRISLEPGQSHSVRLRLTDSREAIDFDAVFSARRKEADEFYATIVPEDLSEDARNVMRQALGGMLWSKQFYHYVVRDWLTGDPGNPAPPEQRKFGRNAEWTHLYNSDVISMPDKWEYPWYAAWDLAFHCVALAVVD
ncbi:MAG: glucosidase, partial [Bryobacteraceae bacterium]